MVQKRKRRTKREIDLAQIQNVGRKGEWAEEEKHDFKLPASEVEMPRMVRPYTKEDFDAVIEALNRITRYKLFAFDRKDSEAPLQRFVIRKHGIRPADLDTHLLHDQADDRDDQETWRRIQAIDDRSTRRIQEILEAVRDYQRQSLDFPCEPSDLCRWLYDHLGLDCRLDGYNWHDYVNSDGDDNKAAFEELFYRVEQRVASGEIAVKPHTKNRGLKAKMEAAWIDLRKDYEPSEITLEVMRRELINRKDIEKSNEKWTYQTQGGKWSNPITERQLRETFKKMAELKALVFWMEAAWPDLLKKHEPSKITLEVMKRELINRKVIQESNEGWTYQTQNDEWSRPIPEIQLSDTFDKVAASKRS